MTAAPIDGPGLDDLAPEALLDALADADRQVREGEREKLRIAHQWAVLHPATADTGVATWGGDSLLLPALLTDESLGGDGCPKIAAYAPEPLAITLGVAPTTAMQLIADALDLHHRLPETWAQVDSLAVPAWKGRQVARLTHSMSREAAAWVDEKIAPRLARCGARLLDTVVAEAIARHDPDRHAEREARAKKQVWDVALFTPTAPEYAATSELHITGDTLWLTDLYRQVCADRRRKRRRPAARRPQGRGPGHLFSTGVRDSLAGPRAPGHAGGREVAQRPSRDPAHRRPSSTSTSTSPTSTTTSSSAGRAERLGPVSRAKIREWVGDSQVRIQPVIRMDGDEPVNGHDPPDRMRDQVILRDSTCQFPSCQVDSRRCDLDHVIPYDPHGPPGQTRPSNLVAALPPTPQRQDQRSLALRPHARRRVRVERSVRQSRARLTASRWKFTCRRTRTRRRADASSPSPASLLR